MSLNQAAFKVISNVQQAILFINAFEELVQHVRDIGEKEGA